MLPISRPEIFISATSADLKTCRQGVRDALLTMGCTPVEQTTFPPDARTVREMLRARIASCRAVVHIAGEVYGSEPKSRPADEPRRSYTQLEYEIARQLGKPVYVFICGERFPYDSHEGEDEERQRLQQEHRRRLTSGDHRYESVGTRDELEKRVLALETRVEALIDQLVRARARWAQGAAIAVVLVLALGLYLIWLNQGTSRTPQRTEQAERRVEQVETELDRQRRYIKAVANAYGEQQRQLAELRLTGEQTLDRAVAVVAECEGVDTGELRAGIDVFVAAVRDDPEAEFLDRALADFAEQRFASASENAGWAAEKAEARMLAAKAVAEGASAEMGRAPDQVREARTLQGRSSHADRRFGEAVAAFEAALSVTPRKGMPVEWGSLQVDLGKSLLEWAGTSQSAEIAARRSRAIEAYRAALEVYAREAEPREWAVTQITLAVALHDQASAWEGAERARLIGEAVAAYRAAMQVYTREAMPQQWAWMQNSLGSALMDQASASEGPERDSLLGEAVAAFRDALRIRTREAMPQDWAITQINLGNALLNQAWAAEWMKQLLLLNEGIAALRGALEQLTFDSTPREWAAAKHSLGSALRSKAVLAGGGVGSLFLREAVEAHLAALEVRTLEATPREWAETQVGLALALRELAYMSARTERSELLARAVEAMRAYGEVYTAEVDPRGSAWREQWIAEVEAQIGKLGGR